MGNFWVVSLLYSVSEISLKGSWVGGGSGAVSVVHWPTVFPDLCCTDHLWCAKIFLSALYVSTECIHLYDSYPFVLISKQTTLIQSNTTQLSVRLY
jgi:hypothetical protein